MKTMILIAAITLGFGAAHAEDANQANSAVPKAHVLLVESTPYIGPEVKISPSDYPNGLYVVAKKAFTEYPVSASLFAEKLRAQGFKIAQSAVDADATVRVVSSTISFSDIDQDKDTVSAAKIDGVAGAVILGVATSGLSLLSSDFSFLNDEKPHRAHFNVIVEPKDKAKGDLTSGMSGLVKADASNSKVSRGIFDLMADEWLKAHLVGYVAKASETTALPSTATKQ